MSNKTILQYFEWYLPDDGHFWERTARDAAHLAELGFTDVWLPPAYKGQAGKTDVGYGVYDLYDLGEFDQKGTIATKYGTRDEYLAAIKALQAHGIGVIGDIVLNHRMGADEYEITTGSQMFDNDRLRVKIPRKLLKVWTRFTFPGRNGKYSDFTWNKDHFNGTDWNQLTRSKGIFKFWGHNFNRKVDSEKGNYDYLMGCNVDMTIPEVREELKTWGKWYMDTTGLDAVRLDAVKHISYAFFPEWMQCIRDHKGKNVFAVGEYWHKSIDALMKYLDNCGRCMTLFDVPLHYKFQWASRSGRYFSMKRMLANTLVARDPEYAVTFVDNHDTQPHQALESWVEAWFKPLAYAIILLRDTGTPCVFFGDLYGIPSDNIPPVPGLKKILKARQRFATGAQTDYFDHHNTVGWTREGGLAVVMTNGDEGWKYMKLGKPGQVFVDLLDNRKEEVVIAGNGQGRFTVNARSVSIWVPKEEANC